MKFEWELLDNHIGTWATYRAKVYGGWIVNTSTDNTESSIFVSDPEHKWEID